jgi:hypothetical protein
MTNATHGAARVSSPLPAILRLLAVAKRDTGQSTICANFLLSWWNSQANGGFDLTDMWGCDRQIREDMLTVLAFIAWNHEYPTFFKLGAEFEALVGQWRK